MIEVLTCVAILAGIMITMFGVYTHVTVEIRRSRNRSIAVRAAQMILETVLASPYDARTYHGLSSETSLPSSNPLQIDVLNWRHTLATFPIKTVARIAVEETSACIDVTAEEETLTLCPELLKVTVEISYRDHGREATQTLSLTLEPG